MTAIYIYLRGEELGPFERDELQVELRAGRLASDTPARIGNTVTWGNLGDLLGSFPRPATPYSPPPLPGKHDSVYTPPSVPIEVNSSYVPPALTVSSSTGYVPPPLAKAESSAQRAPASFPVAARSWLGVAVGVVTVGVLIALYLVFRSPVGPRLLKDQPNATAPGVVQNSPQAETESYLTKTLPNYLKLNHLLLQPGAAGTFQLKADLLATEDLYRPEILHTGLEIPDPNSNLPAGPRDLLTLKRITQVGQHLEVRGTIEAARNVNRWQLRSVAILTKLADFGGPRHIFAPEIVVPGTPDGDLAVTNWNASIAAYKQTMTAARLQNTGDTTAVAPSADAPAPTPPPETSATPIPSTVVSPPVPPPLPPTESVFPNFDGNEIVQRCHNAGVYQPEIFSANFQDRTYVWSGTVARYNTSEGLIIFRGGGIYPLNWDLQIASTDRAEFPLQSRVRLQFRLNKMLVLPFAGVSFRGDHLRKLRKSAE